MTDDAGQYAIQVLERKIESLTAAMGDARKAHRADNIGDWHQRGMCDGLQIAIDALRLEIPFVKLERGPLIINNKE